MLGHIRFRKKTATLFIDKTHIIPDFSGGEESMYLEYRGGIFYRNIHDHVPETKNPKLRKRHLLKCVVPLMSNKGNASAPFGLPLFPDVQFLTSSHLNNKFIIDPHPGIAGG